jgi:hypothetical protein
MSLTFYDRSGASVAYTDDGEHIFHFTGKPLAYIHGRSIYSYSGSHLGWFENGLIRDQLGNTVFFSRGSRGGPMKPIRQIAPIKGVRRIKPIKRVRQIAPIRPVKTLSWSALSATAFFSR